jgi:protein tyrosine/serine phosphatase
MVPKQWARRLGAALAIVLVASSATYYYWVFVNHRFMTITEGQVYKSAEMSPAELKEKVKKYGIRTVIDLRHTGPWTDAERQAMQDVGVRYFSIPSRQVPTDDVVKKFVAVMDETMANPDYQAVLIHCKHGTGRAPLFSSLYRVEYEGWSNEAARNAIYWETGMGNFASDSRKGRYILGYVPRSKNPGQ